MGKLTYLVIHCADTPYDREVSADDIVRWHKGALKNSNGTYTFLGKTYSLTNLKQQTLVLPSGQKINAAQTNGRGWQKAGYADLIQRSGNLVNITPYNYDDQIETWEVTNGVANYNSVSRHVCLAGGWLPDQSNKSTGKKNGQYLKAEDLYSKAQIDQLVSYIKMQLELQPNLIVCGHNQLAIKPCPCFQVPVFLKDHGINCKTLSTYKY